MSKHPDVVLAELGPNIRLLDSLYRRYEQDPEAVSPAWREFFEGFTLQLENEVAPKTVAAPAPAPSASLAGVPGEPAASISVSRLINMYRVRGHLLAEVNPLGTEGRTFPELDLAFYGLSERDLDREFFVDDLPGAPHRTLRELIDLLRRSYCRSVGIEYMHIQEPEQKRWIQERVEGVATELPLADKRRILEWLNAAEAFERFLHTKYVGHKRFSLEGAEALIPMVDGLLDAAAVAGVKRVVLGMAHRGRLNVLANIVGKSYERIFTELEGDIDPETTQGSGDVKYHLGASGTYTGRSGVPIQVDLASNPSHLESVYPVVEGMVRAQQDGAGDRTRQRTLALLLHGDAAFAGEGVVAETLAMSQLPGFLTGGTVHIVTNNQLGFTTPAAAARSSTYATDVAKMVQAPILHVNADDPEACLRAVRLAFEFRQVFHKDVVVDLICYRRYGHNEADDPSYTQPIMYAKIGAHPPVRKLYLRTLIYRGDVSLEEAEAALEDYQERLQRAFYQTRESAPLLSGILLRREPERRLRSSQTPETAVQSSILERILRAVTTWPDDFTPHPKLASQMERRRELFKADAVDWSMAEAFAFGSLVLQGLPVRLSGQDSRRGTFSQRHAVIVDHRTGGERYPLAELAPDQATFQIYDGPLNEFATMGFEYGYSVVATNALVCWEAQFGDFVNEAQVIVDQFLVAAEEKWGQSSRLVLLLPHGYEGQGPEHSSGRLERFLALAAGGNIEVVVPSTPAQYFHLLRRQALGGDKVPLVAFTPKSLLRLPTARSRRAEFVRGGFQEVLADRATQTVEAVETVLLCSGKVFYDLDRYRQENEVGNIALVRVERLYPFPREGILEALSAYANAQAVRWVQEEPENMGAYRFVHWHLHRHLPESVLLEHVSRPESGTPATGSVNQHSREQAALVEAAFEI